MNQLKSSKLWVVLAGVIAVIAGMLAYGILFLNFFRRLRFWYRGLPYYAPLDISPITDQLFVAAWPASQHAEELKALTVRLIICMFWEPQDRALKKPPFENLQLNTVDFFLLPIPLGKLIQGVETALPILARGERVMAYCKQGVHRSVAQVCCILVAQGYTAQEAMQLVKLRRPVADPYAPHIRRRIEKFELYWRQRS